MFDSGRIFGGTLLVLAGVLLFLSNAGYIEWGFWRNLISLWPLLIVALGLRLIFRRGPFAILASLVLVVMVIAAVVMPGYYYGKEADSTYTRNLETGISQGSLSINTGAVDITVKSTSPTSTELIHTEEHYSGPPTVWTYNRGGSTATVTGERKGGDAFFVIPFSMGGVVSTGDIMLNPTVPWSFVVNSGACKMEFDLSNIELRDLKINSGASNIDVILGKTSANSYIEANVGLANVTFDIPNNIGVRITRESALTGGNINDQGFDRRGDSLYSSNYDSADQKVHIRLTGGLSSFNIRRVNATSVSI